LLGRERQGRCPTGASQRKGGGTAGSNFEHPAPRNHRPTSSTQQMG
jgi:hypothetical protein